MEHYRALVMSVETLKELIVHNLDVADFLDIIGYDLADLVEHFQDEIVENFDALVSAVE